MSEANSIVSEGAKLAGMAKPTQRPSRWIVRLVGRYHVLELHIETPYLLANSSVMTIGDVHITSIAYTTCI